MLVTTTESARYRPVLIDRTRPAAAAAQPTMKQPIGTTATVKSRVASFPDRKIGTAIAAIKRMTAVIGSHA